jgi:drug/metabolite transporter (DMT)-like permease
MAPFSQELEPPQNPGRFKAQVESPPTRIALILVLEPVFGGLFGYLLGGDRLSAINLSGAALIIVAMVVTEFKPGMRAVSS